MLFQFSYFIYGPLEANGDHLFIVFFLKIFSGNHLIFKYYLLEFPVMDCDDSVHKSTTLLVGVQRKYYLPL